MISTVASKVCTRCGEDKPLTDYYVDRQKSDGRAMRCRSCKSAAAAGQYARWTPAQRQKHRERVMRSRYGISMDLVRNLYEQQEGCCAICSAPGDFPTSSEKGRSRAGLLCIDHDHDTGVVRGLLCHNCNSALGKLGDSVDRLVKAAAYLLDRGGQ